MERETGIEPATNSLEGCDSTTELLPPSRGPLRAFALRRASPRALVSPWPVEAPANTFAVYLRQPQHTQHLQQPCVSSGRCRTSRTQLSRLACQPKLASARSATGGGRLVAREGFEPSKPLGRQIYSLLRLTASLPRRSQLSRFSVYAVLAPAVTRAGAAADS